MIVICEECKTMYDDARKWTICPHPSLDGPCPAPTPRADESDRLEQRRGGGEDVVEPEVVEPEVVEPEVVEPEGVEPEGVEPEERDENDFLNCASCGKEHDRYYRENGTTLTWQVVVFNARSEYLSDNSEHGTVCRVGECANKWFVANAPVVAEKMKALYDDKLAAEKRNAKIAAGIARGKATS